MKNKRLLIILATATGLLLIPFIAMQFGNEVNWTGHDFTVMGFLLFGTGLICELVLRNVKNFTNRVIVCGVILLALFLIWAELSVGIIGTPFAGT